MANRSCAESSANDRNWANHRARYAFTDASVLLVEHDAEVRDHLVAKVRLHLEGPTRRPKMPFTSTLNGSSTGDGKGGNNAGRVDLVLYVDAKSTRCDHAIRTIKGVVSKFPSNRVSLTIHDLAADPAQGAEDCISYTPTLVRRSPLPRTFILGDITNPELVLELLQGAGEEGV